MRVTNGDDKRVVEQEVNKRAMAGQQAAALSPPHVYYSRPLVGPRSRSDVDGQLLLRRPVPGSWQSRYIKYNCYYFSLAQP